MYENNIMQHMKYYFSRGKRKLRKYIRCPWLMPVVLASQEAEIRRITF
jgi:hypothetical protein